MWKKILIVVLFGVSVVDAEIDPFLELCLDFQLSMPSVKEVKYGVGTISEAEGNGPWLTELRFLRLGLRTDLTESIAWRNYADLSVNCGYFQGLGADRNYETEERGYGAAFWSVGYDFLTPGFRSELCFEDGWFLGVGLRQYGVGILTGRKGYNVRDYSDFTRIGKLMETSVYGGWSSETKDHQFFGDLRVGLNFNRYGEKEKYRDIDVSVNEIAPFVAFNLGWRF